MGDRRPRVQARDDATRSLVAGGIAAVLIAAAMGAVAMSSAGGSAPERLGAAGFEHLASFDVTTNDTTTATEITVSDDGMVALYTDEVGHRIGLVDLTTPTRPAPAGVIELAGRPTDVAVREDRVWVAIEVGDVGGSPAGGRLEAFGLRTRASLGSVDLRGGPAGLDVSPDGTFVAVAVENSAEPDRPDAPGRLVVVRADGPEPSWLVRDVDLSGTASIDPTDPEPEGVSINEANVAVVTLQENNHVVLVDLERAAVTTGFDAGSVTLERVDAVEEQLGPQEQGVIALDATVTERREPGPVVWLDEDRFALATEGGDAGGGSRGVSVFGTDTELEFDVGAGFEHAVVSIGHFDEDRAEDRGIEPEGIAAADLDGRRLIAVTASRANVVGIFERAASTISLLQVVPTGARPVGVEFAADRGLLVVAAPGTHEEGEYPSLITVYGSSLEPAASIHLGSDLDRSGTPIPWTALSGLTSDPETSGRYYAVNDSSLAEASIYAIDASTVPARIVDRVVVRDRDGTRRVDLDLEGVAIDPAGGVWVVSEGRSGPGPRPALLLRIDRDGVVREEIPLPDELQTEQVIDSGLEGVAVSGTEVATFVYLAHQAPWTGDPAGVVRITRYDPAAGSWTQIGYPLDIAPAGSTGVSDIAVLPDGRLAVLERDNLGGPQATVKRVYAIDVERAPFTVHLAGSRPIVVAKELVEDLVPVLRDASIWTPNKPEGLAVDPDGSFAVVTDNDGLDQSIGETVFVRIPHP